MAKNKKNSTKQKQTKVSAKSKVLYVVAGIVLLIPLMLLAYIYFGAKENSGKPVVGSRFDKALDPAITEEQVTKLKSTLKYDGVQNLEVNLNSATLRINIDTKDDISDKALSNILKKAYDDVDGILAVSTYFTNKDDVKMYDLEVHVYNFIPDATHKEDQQLYAVKTKTGAGKEAVTDVITSPKNSKLAKELLKTTK